MWRRAKFGVLVLALFAATLGGCRALRIQPVRDPTLVENPAVVSIVGWWILKTAGGSGFFVAPDRVVTCRHVVVGWPDVYVRLGDSRQLAARGVLAESKEHDLVMLEVGPVPGLVPLAIVDGDREPAAGERLTAIGSPGLRAQTVSDLVVDGGRFGGPRFGPRFEVRGRVEAGSSGSPVLDASGRVVGVLATSPGVGRGGVVPARFVRELVPGPLRPMRDWGERTAAEPEVSLQRECAAAVKDFREGDPSAALRRFERLLPRAGAVPGLPESVALYVVRCLRATSPRDAEDRLRRDLAPYGAQAWSHGILADSLNASGRPEPALVEAREAIRLDPKDVRWPGAETLALAGLGRWAEAEAGARRMIALDSVSVDGEYYLGMALWGQRRLPEGIPHLERSARLAPRSARILTNLGEAYRASGREAEGLAALEEATRLDPAFAPAAEALARARAAPAGSGAPSR